MELVVTQEKKYTGRSKTKPTEDRDTSKGSYEIIAILHARWRFKPLDLKTQKNTKNI